MCWVGNAGGCWGWGALSPGSALSQVQTFLGLALEGCVNPWHSCPVLLPARGVRQAGPSTRAGAFWGELSPCQAGAAGLSPVMAGSASPLTSQQE